MYQRLQNSSLDSISRCRSIAKCTLRTLWSAIEHAVRPTRIQNLDSEEIVPALSIVPLVGIHDDGGCGPFLGTGFFVGEPPVLVTCEHVLSSWNGQYGFSAHEDQPGLYSATPIRRDPNVDIAILEATDYSPPKTLLLEEESPTLNNLVNCFEYGTTLVAGSNISFSPANRLGNITRILDLTDQFGPAGSHMLELSFPALKGASGAPILTWRPPFKVCGILKANVARELLPAHIEEVYDESGNIEASTQFLLPQALAIHVMHLRELLLEL